MLASGENRPKWLFLPDDNTITPPSHSVNSITVTLDDGTAVTDDLEPQSYIDAYADNEALKAGWEKIISFHPAASYTRMRMRFVYNQYMIK